MTLQEMVQYLVNDLGWTQEEIGRKAGVSQPVVHRALRGSEKLHYSTGKKLEQLYLSSASNDNAPAGYKNSAA